MISRRMLLALPLLAACPALSQPADRLARVLVDCWHARGAHFTVEQIRQRIGEQTGKAALQSLAGAITDANGDDQEIAVEIIWENGGFRGAGQSAMLADLAQQKPLLLLTSTGQPLLLLAAGPHGLVLQGAVIGWGAAALIGRPVVAGA